MQSYKDYEICDAHTHIFPAKVAEKASIAIGDFYDTKMCYPGDTENLLNSGKQINVTKYLVCSTATVPEQVSKINQFIIGECQAHSELVGFGTLHPDNPNFDEEIQVILNGGLKGVKLHPDFQNFAIDDEKAFPIYEKCQGKLPVLIHMGDNRYDGSRPFRLANIMSEFPKLEVFAAHFGGYRRWDESIATLMDFENIYFDTSSTLGFVDLNYAKEIASHFDKDKLMFGTDFPMWDHKEELERFFALGFSEQDNRKILSDNFKRILKV